MSLKAEFDLTEQIHRSQKELNIKATFQHVKGHQDRVNKKEDLSLIVQMNVEADEAAGEYRIQYGKYLPVTPVLPACPVVLSIQGQSITKNYPTHLI